MPAANFDQPVPSDERPAAAGGSASPNQAALLPARAVRPRPGAPTPPPAVLSATPTVLGLLQALRRSSLLAVALALILILSSS